MLGAGLALTGLMLLAFGIGWHLYPDHILPYAIMTGLNLIIGREAGLFVFVFAPFWMTGPVVGAIIGFLIGLRPWVNLAVVLVATYIALGLWALLLNELNVWAAHVNQLAPYLLFLAILLIAAAIEWVARHRERSARSEHD